MKLSRLLLIGAFFLLALAPAAQAQEPAIVGLQLEGVVDPLIASYVRSGIEFAASSGSDAILITIDTPGGLDSAMRDIIKAITNSKIPVICYVAPEGARAASAGTFILISCPVAAMAPATNVGAAHPVGIFGAIEQEKAVNDGVAYIRSLAELRGRNADWAEDAVRDSVSVSATRALELKVIDLVAEDHTALLNSIDGREVKLAGGREVTLETKGGVVTERGLGFGPSIIHPLFSPNLAFIFFYLGLVLLAVELLHPGVSVPGILGVLSMVAAFAGLGMLPIQLIGVGMLVASVIFFLLELQHPGLGLPTLGGIVTLVLGGLLLFNPSVPGVRVSWWAIIPVALAAGGFFAFAVNAVLRTRLLPPTNLAERVVGAEGVAATRLNPTGIVQVASETWTAESVGGPIAKGDQVRVIEAEGLRVKVEPIKKKEGVSS